MFTKSLFTFRLIESRERRKKFLDTSWIFYLNSSLKWASEHWKITTISGIIPNWTKLKNFNDFLNIFLNNSHKNFILEPRYTILTKYTSLSYLFNQLPFVNKSYITYGGRGGQPKKYASDGEGMVLKFSKSVTYILNGSWSYRWLFRAEGELFLKYY